MNRRPWVLIATLLVLSVPIVVARVDTAEAAPVRTFTYSVGTKGAVVADVREFADTAFAVLNHPRGWGLDGAVRFEPVLAGGNFRLLLASPSAIEATSRVCSDDFSCRVGNEVMINDDRWRFGSAPYTGSLADYRSYVISHEVGHWLGFGHARCPAPGQPAPIMVQQSKGLGGCAPTSFPSNGERQTLATRFATVVVPPTFGSLDVVAVGDGTVRVAGWAIDATGVEPVDVHVYVDGVGTAFTADVTRPDVAAAHPDYGELHGFDATLALAPGVHDVCVYAIGHGGRGNVTLGCAPVDYASPFGSLDVAVADGSTLRVAGWAIDPHTITPIDVHVYVGERGIATRADRDRPDVALVFPSAGSAHGFELVTPIDADATVACAYGIDVGGGANRLLGCRAITR